MSLKRFVATHPVTKSEMFAASTKFALIELAETHHVRLETLLKAAQDAADLQDDAHEEHERGDDQVEKRNVVEPANMCLRV